VFQSKTLEGLVAELKKLPGIGAKSATRIAFHLLRTSREEVESLSMFLLGVKEKVRLCSVCGNYTEEETCELCRDPKRDEALICVVEQPSDVYLVEATGAFRGRYHVLHGVLSPLEGVRPEALRIGELVERARAGSIREVILATNPTVEGDATAFYIAEAMKELPVEVSRIARGVPVGGEIEFADQMTLARALEGRRGL
jgi:recombination protein RecR